MGIRNKKVMRTRTLFCGLSLMMATLGFVACTEEHVENITNEDNNSGDTNTGDETKLIPMTFTAVGSSCSRTELQPDNSVYWSPGDSICVFTTKNLEAKYLFVTDINQVSPTASFHGEIEESDTYIAYYPYPKSSNQTMEIRDGLLVFYVPTEQKAVNGGFDTSLNPSYAVADSENKLLFKNLCCLMKFTFTGEGLGEVRKVSITANNNMPLSQIVDYNLEGKVCACRDVNAAYPSTLVSDKFENGGTYYFVIPPFEGALENGFKISFYNESGVEVWSKSTKSNIPLTAGRILNMGTIEVKKDVDYEIAEDGTYLVYKASGLKAWADHVKNVDRSTNVTLMNDITFDVNEYWTPVNATYGYNGVFDGNGKTIKGLKIGKSGSKDLRNAIFSKLESNGVIKKLTVDSPVCYGGTYLSVLAGSCEKGSSIIDCHINNAKLECVFGGCSGIICGGLYEGYIEGCTATGTVNGNGVNEVGGLVGIFSSQGYNGSENPLMVCCSFEGEVIGYGNYYGGIAGKMGGQMKGCYAVAAVSGNNYVGGLFGEMSGYNSLTASYFKGSVNGTLNTGLLIGSVSSKTFTPVNAYYCQDGGDVSAAVGNKNFTEFVKVENNVWDAAIEDMNNNIGDTYKYKYVWDETKQHPVLQATE